jgi:hypothetical protein
VHSRKLLAADVWYDRFGNRWVSSSAGFLFSDVHEPTVETNINKWTNQLNASLFDPRATNCFSRHGLWSTTLKID